jgi:hypothetical protein
VLSRLVALARSPAPDVSAAAVAALAASGDSAHLAPLLATFPSLAPALVAIVAKPHPKRRVGTSAAVLLQSLAKDSRWRPTLLAYEGPLAEVAGDFREHHGIAARAPAGPQSALFSTCLHGVPLLCEEGSSPLRCVSASPFSPPPAWFVLFRVLR